MYLKCLYRAKSPICFLSKGGWSTTRKWASTPEIIPIHLISPRRINELNSVAGGLINMLSIRFTISRLVSVRAGWKFQTSSGSGTKQANPSYAAILSIRKNLEDGRKVQLISANFGTFSAISMAFSSDAACVTIPEFSAIMKGSFWTH